MARAKGSGETPRGGHGRAGLRAHKDVFDALGSFFASLGTLLSNLAALSDVLCPLNDYLLSPPALPSERQGTVGAKDIK